MTCLLISTLFVVSWATNYYFNGRWLNQSMMGRILTQVEMNHLCISFKTLGFASERGSSGFACFGSERK